MPLESRESIARLPAARRPGRERRSSLRTFLGVQGTITLTTGACPVVIRDISTGGAGLIARRKVRRGDQFVLTMPATNGLPAVQALCIVVSVRALPGGSYFFGVIRLRELNRTKPTPEAPAA
ncbi:MAG: hypothetical protein JWP03_625 [Phycisphaerales bacterium]|jgi:hypothetical protein|nr:hypothetical protein [Phycisphaerales bacterium]